MPSEARIAAYAVLRRTFEGGAYADQAFHAASRGLTARDRALAMRLAYGAVQRRGTVDHLISQIAGRPSESLDAPLLAALRLGTYELCFAATAAHAAVNDAVELVGASRGRGLVNAVLRRVARDHVELLGALDDTTPQTAAIYHSMPTWIVEMWWDSLGPAGTRALLTRLNEPAESVLRANTLRCDSATLAASLPVAASVPGDPVEAVILHEPFDVYASAAWREGLAMAQSRAAMLVAHALDPLPGERVLDLCAAPGGKTTHLAALMGARGEIVALERHPGRARALERTAARMGAENVSVLVADGTAAPVERGGFDRVLVDPPCSGLGTMHSRPDLRWRVTADGTVRLAAEQARLLSHAAAALAPGGRLVYSTCTISPQENERQIGALLDGHPELSVIDLEPGFPAWAHPGVPGQLLALPHVQGSDGFFIAALEARG